MTHESKLQAIITNDHLRMAVLEIVAGLELPNCWIAAGFVRNAVWDNLHGRKPRAPQGDVDVIWFDPINIRSTLDHEIESTLIKGMPSFDWSVKNQARMHERNGDKPYTSSADAMAHWPETATAVGVRLTESHALEIEAPYGLDDLFALRLRPTPHFNGIKRSIFDERVHTKNWLQDYPNLTLCS